MKPTVLTLSLALLVGTNTAYAKPVQTGVQAGKDIAVASVQNAQIRGFIQNGVMTFKGITYADAKRFMPPVLTTPVSQNALTNGNICPQGNQNPMDNFLFAGGKFSQSDDCLNLNIWTPATDTAKPDNKKRPVMVWFHGGGFMAGSSLESDAYDGANLAKSQDVVVVSVNHRLNAMGYLDLSGLGGAYQNSVNLGVQDMVASLEWIRQNIANFGGDPNNVTVFGESGGGAKVITLMGTPSAKGLFHKAIVQSGALQNMGMKGLDPQVSKRVAELTLQNLGVDKGSVDKLNSLSFAEIDAASAKALQQTAQEFDLKDALTGTRTALAWSPIRDGKIIPQHPMDSSLATGVPLLIGSNMSEWTSFPLQTDFAKSLTDNKNTWTNEQLEAKLSERFGTQKQAVLSAFKQAYPKRPVADSLYTDSDLRVPALQMANAHAPKAPVYNYVFAWDTPVMDGIPMSYHTAEIAFVMNNIDKAQRATGGTKHAYALADKMSRAWGNFAKTGNPNAQGLPNWTPYTKANGATMIFDNQSELRQHHDRALMQLLKPQAEF